MTGNKQLNYKLSNRLSAYMRINFNLYIRPLYIKEVCECCGSGERLELHHHDKHFAQILNETLDLLGLEYQTYVSDFSENEIEIIKHVVTGMHLQIGYKTLCRHCHDELHKTVKVDKTNYYKNLEIRRMKKKKKEEINEVNNLIPYLETNVGNLLLSVTDRDALIEYANIRHPKNNRLVRNIESINDLIIPMGYYIELIDSSIVINGKRKRFKRAWKILRLNN